MATKQFARLSSLVKNDNLVKAIAQCDTMLASLPGDRDILKTKCVSLIWLGKYEEAAAVCKLNPELKFELAYCLYRLNKISESEDILNEIKETSSVLHLKAQLKYRSGNFVEAAKLYSSILNGSSAYKRSSRAYQEVMSNFLAASIESGDSQSGLDKVTQAQPKSDSKKTPQCYELEYNRACALLKLQEYDEASKALTQAHDAGSKVLEQDDFEQDEIEAELAIVNVQKGYLEQLQGNEEEAQKMYLEALRSKPVDSSAVAIASNNLFVARLHRDLFDSYKRSRQSSSDLARALEKMSPTDKKSMQFNRALLFLFMNKSEECRDALTELEKEYPESEFPIVVKASLFMQQKKQSKALEVMKKSINEAVQNGNDDKVSKLSLALAQMSIADGRFSDAIVALENIPPHIRHAPAIVATLVALYEKSDQLEKCESVLQSAIDSCRSTMEGVEDDSGASFSPGKRFFSLLVAQAEFYTRHNWSEKAAKVFSALVDGEEGPIDSSLRARALASLVIVLSQFDPEAAETRAASLPMPEASSTLTPEDLEKQVLPRDAPTIRTTKRKAADAKEKGTASKGVESLKRNAQQLASLARRKEKKRMKFLETLKARHGPDFDPTKQTPDPDRWLPLSERASSSRRFRKKRGAKMTGGQGAGDLAARDAAKFDVREALKQQESKKADEAPRATKKGKKKGKKGRR